MYAADISPIELYCVSVSYEKSRNRLEIVAQQFFDNIGDGDEREDH